MPYAEQWPALLGIGTGNPGARLCLVGLLRAAGLLCGFTWSCLLPSVPPELRQNYLDSNARSLWFSEDLHGYSIFMHCDVLDRLVDYPLFSYNYPT